MLDTALFLFVYFLPAIVGFCRKHHESWHIFALNLLLGWTVVGWIIAMVWAATRVQRLSGSTLSHRAEMRHMRSTLGKIQNFFPKDSEVSALVRMSTAASLGGHLQNRLGIMGPDFRVSLTTEEALEQEGKIFDKLPPEQLAQIVAELDRLGKRLFLERGKPDEWKGSDEIENTGDLFALHLLEGWLKSKAIVHASMNRTIIKEAQTLENLHYVHIQKLLGVFRGKVEEACFDEALPSPMAS